MRNIIILFLLFLAFSNINIWGQTKSTIPAKIFTPVITAIFHKIGDDFIRIRAYQYGETKAPFFIALHDDELTAISATQKLLEKKGGLLIRIDNNNKRNIRFRMNRRVYTFDPNRIFSEVGITETLAMFGMINSKAIDEVDKFAKRVLQLIPETAPYIISLHNNTNGKFSITSYLKGQEREKDARAIRLAPEEDPDDLFLTTDSLFYEKLVQSDFNTILQDNINAKKDGSLSIYCGERNISYLNCETEHGRLKQYENMINFAVNELQKPKTKPKPVALEYEYRLSSDNVATLTKGDIIFFGERKVGTIKFTKNNDGGKIEMIESFPLYDNMDFYIMPIENGKLRIELRIDPTRPRKLYDNEKDVIVMKVVR